MSMPNIPDFKPEIDISFEQALNLLLTSITMEEISLSKLMDTENEIIKYAIEKNKQNNGTMEDILLINNSVNSTIMNISKMQMLLQSKLENLERLISKTSNQSSQPSGPKEPTISSEPGNNDDN